MVTEVRPQFEKAYSPIVVTEGVITIDFNQVQKANVLGFIAVMFVVLNVVSPLP